MFLTETGTTGTLSALIDDPSALEQLWNQFLSAAGSFAGKLVLAIIIWIIGRRLVKSLLKLTAKGFEKGNFEKGISKFIQSVLKFALYIFLALIIVETIGVRTSSVIGVLSSATLAIGLSFQGSLSNVAGGLLIIIFKPFTVGDYIISSGVEGTVDAIDILYTKLYTVDNKLVTVPNGTLSNATVTNVGKEQVRRLDIPMGISYESDIQKAKEVLLSIVNESTYVMKDKDIRVIVTELAASSVNLEVRIWVRTENYWDAKFYFLEKFKTVFDEAGISIPYRQLDVHMK